MGPLQRYVDQGRKGHVPNAAWDSITSGYINGFVDIDRATKAGLAIVGPPLVPAAAAAFSTRSGESHITDASVATNRHGAGARPTVPPKGVELRKVRPPKVTGTSTRRRRGDSPRRRSNDTAAGSSDDGVCPRGRLRT